MTKTRGASTLGAVRQLAPSIRARAAEVDAAGAPMVGEPIDNPFRL